MIRVEKIDEVYLRVTSTPDIEAELSEHFKLEVPGAKYMPSYKNKMWDGFARLYSAHKKTLYVGLLSYLQYFAKTNDYEISIDKELQETTDITREETETFVTNLNCHSNGKPIISRNYQIESIYQSLKRKRLIISSPTSSGKSLSIYAIIRYLVGAGKRVLLVVPRSALVEQMVGDFKNYSSENGWDVEVNCAKLYSGMPKTFDKNVTVTTWQGIYKNPKNWFINQKWDAICVDEVQGAKSDSIRGILEKLPNTKYRIGLSGTTHNTQCARLILEGCFGDISEVISTKELMDKKQISNLKIKSIILDYPEEIKKQCVRLEYQKEIDFLITNQKRNKFIVNLAKATVGTTLILAQFIEKQCDVYHEYLKNNSGGKPVYYITGRISVEKREEIRRKMETEENVILISSFGAMSTGINVPSIQNIIFSTPTKSSILTLQSIGRGLRLMDGKSQCTLFDITDNLCYKRSKNFSFLHGSERVKLYVSQQFDVRVSKVNLYQLKTEQPI